EEAGGEPAEAAVAEPRLGLLIEQLVEIDAELAEHLAVAALDPERLEVSEEGATEEKLGREVVDALGLVLGVGPLGRGPALHQAVADAQGERHVAVEGGGAVEVVATRELEVVDEGAPEGR